MTVLFHQLSCLVIFVDLIYKIKCDVIAREIPDPSSIIQLHPESQAVTLNSTVRLQCSVRMLVDPETGSSAQVYWSKNDFGIGGNREDIQEYGKNSRYAYSRYDLPYNLKEGQYDLQITNVELSDEGAYVCQVNFMKQQYLSQTAVLTVQVPSEAPQLMQIIKGKKSMEEELSLSKPAIVDDGSVMQILCVALHGKPGAHITWIVDGVPIKTRPSSSNALIKFNAGFSGNITFREKPSTKIPRLVDSISTMSAHINKLHHGKLIECRADNAGYELHTLRPAQTKIEVHYAPVVSIQIRPPRPDNLYMEHDIITLECNAHGRPDNFFWEWFVNGRQIENIAESWNRFRLTRELHQAVFRCIAISNKKGYAESRIKVKFGPQFIEPSALLFTASPGENVVMSCPARGNPAPHIEWRREGSREILSRSETLKREHLREEDFGTYICTAFIPEFSPVSKQMYIAKRKPPRIQPNPIVYAQLGQSSRLRCTVNSVPLPPMGQTHWHFHGHPIQEDAQHKFEREEFIGGVVLVLHLAHVMMTDFGPYNCTVSNGYGADWKLIRLSHQEDVPMQFIIGSAVAVGILLIVGLMLLCICRQRVCGPKYHKGNSNKKSNQGSLQEYGVINSDFKVRPCTPNSSSHHDQYQSYNSHCEMNKACSNYPQELIDQGILNKRRQDNYFLDITKNNYCTNSSIPIGNSSAYCPNFTNCQLVQPLCNGGAYIPNLNHRLMAPEQASSLTGCPSTLSTTGLAFTHTPDFMYDAINMQQCEGVGSLKSNCLYSPNGHLLTNLPELTALDLTNGISNCNLQAPISVDSVSAQSSLDATRSPISSTSIRATNSHTATPEHLLNTHYDYHTTKASQVSSILGTTQSTDISSSIPGIAYLINDHTTNV